MSNSPYAPSGQLGPPPPGFATAEFSRPGGRELASPGDRFLARLIDGAILMIPSLVLSAALYVPLFIWLFNSVDAETGEVSGNLAVIISIFVLGYSVAILLTLGVDYLHEVTYQHRKGQTIGKRVMKIRIVQVADGAEVEGSHLRRRWLAYQAANLVVAIPVLGWFLSSVVGLYSWLNILWFLWDKPNKQCLHDKYAKTAVVKLTDHDLLAQGRAVA